MTTAAASRIAHATIRRPVMRRSDSGRPGWWPGTWYQPGRRYQRKEGRGPFSTARTVRSTAPSQHGQGWRASTILRMRRDTETE